MFFLNHDYLVLTIFTVHVMSVQLSICFLRKLGDGLFLNCCREVSKDYPDIEFNDMIIDNASMQVSINLA